MTNLFENNDRAYLKWLGSHEDGYVVNIRRRFDPDYVVLHRAGCSSISRYPTMDTNPGGFTERSYRKLCGTSIAELERYFEQMVDGPYSITRACSKCVPEQHLSTDMNAIFRAFVELLGARLAHGVETTEDSVRYTLFAAMLSRGMRPEEVVPISQQGITDVAFSQAHSG